jgi:hypothetical protein
LDLPVIHYHSSADSEYLRNGSGEGQLTIATREAENHPACDAVCNYSFDVHNLIEHIRIILFLLKLRDIVNTPTPGIRYYLESLCKRCLKVSSSTIALLDAGERDIGSYSKDIRTLACAVSTPIRLRVFGAGAAQTNNIVTSSVEVGVSGEPGIRHRDLDAPPGPAAPMAPSRVHSLNHRLKA